METNNEFWHKALSEAIIGFSKSEVILSSTTKSIEDAIARKLRWTLIASSIKNKKGHTFRLYKVSVKLDAPKFGDLLLGLPSPIMAMTRLHFIAETKGLRSSQVKLRLKTIQSIDEEASWGLKHNTVYIWADYNLEVSKALQGKVNLILPNFTPKEESYNQTERFRVKLFGATENKQ